MESSTEDAILILSKWKEKSSILRVVFGNDNVQITLHGTLANVTAESLWTHGASVEEDLQVYSLTGALIAFVGRRFEHLARKKIKNSSPLVS